MERWSGSTDGRSKLHLRHGAALSLDRARKNTPAAASTNTRSKVVLRTTLLRIRRVVVMEVCCSSLVVWCLLLLTLIWALRKIEYGATVEAMRLFGFN
ncbi:hypothetical protein ACOSQ2_000758 [Xanthoceras sorbifolium]